MKHIRVMGRQRPAPAQFESLIQLVSLLDNLLYFFENLDRLYGIGFPSKSEGVDA